MTTNERENFSKESGLKVAKRNATKTPLKAALEEFNIQTESWELTAKDRAKWRSLIRKRADQYKVKSVCFFKLKESINNEGSPSESLFSEFTCSICNRQFRT